MSLVWYIMYVVIADPLMHHITQKKIRPASEETVMHCAHTRAALRKIDAVLWDCKYRPCL
jgi:hypothetical protein